MTEILYKEYCYYYSPNSVSIIISKSNEMKYAWLLFVNYSPHSLFLYVNNLQIIFCDIIFFHTQFPLYIQKFDKHSHAYSFLAGTERQISQEVKQTTYLQLKHGWGYIHSLRMGSKGARLCFLQPTVL
jgi:hypothetical protein